MTVGFANLPRLTHGGYGDIALTFVRALVELGDRGWGRSEGCGWRVKRRLPLVGGDAVLVEAAVDVVFVEAAGDVVFVEAAGDVVLVNRNGIN